MRNLKPALLLVSLSLSACAMFGPDRNPPPSPEPAHYAVDAQSTRLPSADGVSQQFDPNAVGVSAWWRDYQCAALDALVEEGLSHSPSLASAQASLKAARELLRQQIGQNVFPQIDATFSPERQRALGIPLGPQYETFLENIFVAQVQATYTFDFFGASVMADRALARQVVQQAHQLDATRRALAANIVTATINAAALAAEVEATEKLVQVGNDRARQMADRFDYGSASKSDKFSAEQDAANVAATLPPLRAQALAVRHAQAVLLGRTPDQAPEPLRLDDLHLPQDLPLSVPSELLRRRPDILAAEAAVRAAADQAGAATAALFPTLTLTASYGRGGFDWSTLSSPAGAIWGVGAQLTQPIFHGGALMARRRQYQAVYEGAVADYKRTVLSAFETIADTLVSLDADAQTVHETERAVVAAESIDADTQARYQLGSSAFFATLTATQQVQNDRVQYLRARATRLVDTATLLDAMGDPPAPPVHTHLLSGVLPD
jgi:NodT family efflux transporter outer membrane factor (OMF) lipoprotein